MPKAHTRIDDRFAGTKLGGDVRNPVEEVFTLSPIAMRGPIQDLRVNSIVARRVEKQKR
jgi:hypothetical protein